VCILRAISALEESLLHGGLDLSSENAFDGGCCDFLADAWIRNRSISGDHPLLSRELEFEYSLGSQTTVFELSLPVI
jgi:hypothetical protein